MKKLAVLGLAVAMTFSVHAQEEMGAAGSGAAAGTIGGIATGTVVAGAIAAGVLASVVSNSRSDSLPTNVTPPPTPVLSCEGSDKLAKGYCTGTKKVTTVTVTGTGTGTKTTTISVPVTFTYAPVLK